MKHFDGALNCQSLPEYKRPHIQRFKYYAMTRLKSLEKEAYIYGYDLFKESADNHLPKLSCTLFALQNSLNIAQNERIPDSELFPSNQKQLAWLKNYIIHEKQGYPMDGVRLKIQQLESSELFKF